MPLLLVGILAIYQILLFFVHVAVYQTLAMAFGWRDLWLAIVFGVLSITFVGASILAHNVCNKFVDWIYRIGAYWFGLIHFLFVGGVLSVVLDYLFYRSNIYISPALIGGLCFGAFFIIHTWASWKTAHPEMTRISVALPNLPATWRGKKIVFVSDLHLGNVWGVGFARTVVNFIQAESPEAVFIGGDLFDGTKCSASVSLTPFTSLHTPKGTFFATGNHEYIEETSLLLKAIKEVGIRILDNEMVDLDGLQLVGIDWKDAKAGSDAEKILEKINIDRAKPSILLKHEPSALETSAQAGISLQLSGHTHRGQIFPLQYITARIYHGFDYGLKAFGKMMVFTSSGVGTWGPPLRFGTKAEIVAITLN